MNVLDKWFAWGGLGGGGDGQEETLLFHYFLQKPLQCDCFGTEHNEIIKAFVCLIKLSSFLMPFGTGKIAGLEFTMAISFEQSCSN